MPRKYKSKIFLQLSSSEWSILYFFETLPQIFYVGLKFTVTHFLLKIFPKILFKISSKYTSKLFLKFI